MRSQAIRVFRDAAAWHAIQTDGMAKDFSWNASAAAYVTVYEEAKRVERIPAASVTSNDTNIERGESG